MAFPRTRASGWISFAAIAVSTALLTRLAYLRLGSPEGGIDDADIFLVYARHLSLGLGFVYNAGGEAVEGFSSLLWVGFATAAYALGLKPEPWLLALCVAMLASSAWVVARIVGDYHQGRTRFERVALQAGFLACLALTPDHIVWLTLSQMDGGLWSLLLVLTAGFILHLEHGGVRRAAALSGLLALLVVTRPEAMLWGPALLALSLAKLAALRGRAAALAFAPIPFATLVLCVSVLTGFRLYTFGYPLPNTFYAKVSPSLLFNLQQGADYLIGYLGSNPIVAGSALCALLALGSGAARTFGAARQVDAYPAVERKDLHDLLLGWIAVMGLLVPVLHGGDHFASFRFFQPVYPLLLACFFCHGARLAMQVRGRSPVVAGVAVAAVLASAAWNPVRWSNVGEWGVSIAHEFRLAEEQRRQGKRFAELFGSLRELPSVGVIMAGGFKRNYRGEVIDLMGLNNTTMGHSPGDRRGVKNHAAFSDAVFYELAPDVLAKSCRVSAHMNEIERTGRFLERYQCMRLRLRSDRASGRPVELLVSRPLASRLRLRPELMVVERGEGPRQRPR